MSIVTRQICLITLVSCAIISMCLTTVLFSFIRASTTPSLLIGWIPLILVIIFTCILIIFTSALFALVLMLAFAELRIQLLEHRRRSEQLRQIVNRRASRNVQAQMVIRRRQMSRYGTNRPWSHQDY